MVRGEDINKEIKKTQPHQLRQVNRPVYWPDILSSWAGFRSLSVLNRKQLRILTIILVCLLALVLTGLLINQMRSNADEQDDNLDASRLRARALQQTIVHDDTALAVDFTFNLQMSVNGQPQAIPASYGKFDNGKSIFSAGSAAGDIRVQSPDDAKYTLNDFFLLWGGVFNEKCLLNHCSSQSNSITMTVNGQPNLHWGEYLLKPNDRINITYTD